MYGPDPTPPGPSRAVRAWTMAARIVLAAVSLASLGMLAWIPMLWPALVHRRIRDWLLFAGVGVASVSGMALVGTTEDWRTDLGMVFLLGNAVFVSAYVLAVRLRPRPQVPAGAWPHRPAWPDPALPGPAWAVPPPAPPAYPPAAVPPQDRIGQVRAGLDELSSYLQQQDRP
ncbi:hypothetical protein ACGFX4_10555 [Kitasatospora sp. NPDC048365]|uniref:hypothetical protein n=1 Tax=Kitasatospora sp. NPDC048365 TaxID=3364050 RepID=UPI0037151FF5